MMEAFKKETGKDKGLILDKGIIGETLIWGSKVELQQDKELPAWAK